MGAYPELRREALASVRRILGHARRDGAVIAAVVDIVVVVVVAVTLGRFTPGLFFAPSSPPLAAEPPSRGPPHTAAKK